MIRITSFCVISVAALMAIVVAGVTARADADTVVTNLANSAQAVDGFSLNAAAQSFTTGGVDQGSREHIVEVTGRRWPDRSLSLQRQRRPARNQPTAPWHAMGLDKFWGPSGLRNQDGRI
jgi:hypothetical protein